MLRSLLAVIALVIAVLNCAKAQEPAPIPLTTDKFSQLMLDAIEPYDNLPKDGLLSFEESQKLEALYIEGNSTEQADLRGLEYLYHLEYFGIKGYPVSGDFGKYEFGKLKLEDDVIVGDIVLGHHLDVIDIINCDLGGKASTSIILGGGMTVDHVANLENASGNAAVVTVNAVNNSIDIKWNGETSVDLEYFYTILNYLAPSNVFLSIRADTKTEPDPEPETKPNIEPTDVETTIFRRVYTADFKGIEVLSKDDLTFEVYRIENGVMKIDVKPEPTRNNNIVRIALPAGMYSITFGDLFKDVAVEIR